MKLTTQRVRQYIAEHPGATRIQICAALNITGGSVSSAICSLRRYSYVYSHTTNGKARYFCVGVDAQPTFGVSPGTKLLNDCLAAVRRRGAENQNTTKQA